MLTRAQAEKRLFLEYQRTGSRRDRDALIERFMPLARSLARRYRRGPEPLEDLEQVACLALVRAVEGFDPSRGLAFSSYAVPSISGAVKRHYRDCGWSVRMPRDLQELALRIERFNEEAWATTGAAPTPAQIAERAGVSVEAVIEAREAHQALRADSLDQPLRSSEDDAGASLLDTLGTRDVAFQQRLRSRDARRAAREARRPRPDDRAALLPGGAHPVRDRPAARPLADARLAAAAPGHRAAGRRRGRQTAAAA